MGRRERQEGGDTGSAQGCSTAACESAGAHVWEPAMPWHSAQPPYTAQYDVLSVIHGLAQL